MVFRVLFLNLTVKNIERIILLASSNSEYRDALGKLMTKELIINLLQSKARDFLLGKTDTLANNNQLAFAIEYIRKNQDRQLTVEEVAEKAHMSKSTFYRYFKRHTGITPNEFILSEKIKEQHNVKVRAIEFSLLQRSAAHLASKVDVDEAFMVGKLAVQEALKGVTDRFIGIKRESSNPYKASFPLLPLDIVANAERKVPLEWILPHGAGLTNDYVEYALPLIQGDNPRELENGLPRFPKLKKQLVPKK